jgi:hypothetical protein
MMSGNMYCTAPGAPLQEIRPLTQVAIYLLPLWFYISLLFIYSTMAPAKSSLKAVVRWRVIAWRVLLQVPTVTFGLLAFSGSGSIIGQDDTCTSEAEKLTSFMLGVCFSLVPAPMVALFTTWIILPNSDFITNKEQNTPEAVSADGTV